MAIGKFRQQIYLYEINQGQPDGMGGYLTSESDKHMEWAEVKELKGRRSFEYRQVYDAQAHIFNIRYDSYDVTYDTLLEYESNLYTINSITKDPLKRYIEIIAWE